MLYILFFVSPFGLEVRQPSTSPTPPYFHAQNQISVVKNGVWKSEIEPANSPSVFFGIYIFKKNIHIHIPPTSLSHGAVWLVERRSSENYGVHGVQKTDDAIPANMAPLPGGRVVVERRAAAKITDYTEYRKR